jgi:hypothetical protein
MIPWVLKNKRTDLISLDDILAKIPRPQRSGWLSIILCVSIVLGMVEPVGGEGGFSLACALVPWLCPVQYTYKDYKWKTPQLVTFFPSGKSGGRRPCTCHLDYMVSGKLVQHLHDTQEETCESYHGGNTYWNDVTETWTSGAEYKLEHFPTYVGTDIYYEPWNRKELVIKPEDKFRIHCEDGTEKNIKK